MIDAKFWKVLAENWAKSDDGLIIPKDQSGESEKAKNIKDEELIPFDEINDQEMADILADLGLDDF